MTPAILVSGLGKSFGSSVALDDLELEVAHGEVHGFLGPNGSGKSTTIRILLGLLRADRGTAILLGGDPWKDVEQLHSRLAYVPGDVNLWPNLTGGEVIDLLGRLRGGLNPTKRADLLARFELDPTKKGRTYSKGNRQKVALVAALSSDVDLLLLDEPTSGLDPLMEQVFREVIRDLRQEGRTVLLSSHILSEVEALCDRLTIIKAGRTIETGTLSDLRHLTVTAVDATLEEPPRAGSADDPGGVGGGDGLAWLTGLDGLGTVKLEGDRFTCSVVTAQLGALLERLGAHGIRSLTCQPPTLEQLFMDQYRSDGEPAGAPEARTEKVNR